MLLRARWLAILARLLLTLPFWWSGLQKLAAFNSMAVPMMRQYGLEPPEAYAAASAAVEILGSLLVIAGEFTWLGAGMLGVFTALAILIAHRFWDATGAQRAQEMIAVSQHLSMIGGLMLAAILRGREEAASHPESQRAPLSRTR
jgi:transmembrane protein